VNNALILNDIQNDFCPGGALAVPQGDKIVSVANQYIKIFLKKKYPIFACRDWHPRKTSHFKTYGGVWPVHCIRNTKGARFHPGLKVPRSAIAVYKGENPHADCYSAFDAIDRKKRSLKSLLEKFKVSEIFICGLATDYCIKSSVLDARKLGFSIYVLKDAIQGVNLKKDDSKKAIRQMMRQGAKLITLRQLKKLIML